MYRMESMANEGLVLMSIIWPTHTEPVLPNIPEEEIYEDEDRGLTKR